MLDFTEVKKALIDDIEPLCLNNLKILNELAKLPNEINLLIAYDNLKELLYILEKDVIILRKEELYHMIYTSKDPIMSDVDILSPEYIDYLDMSTIKCQSLSSYYAQLENPVRKCSEALYTLDNQIFYVLKDRIEICFNRPYKYNHVSYFISLMETNNKYASLLK